MSDFPSSKFDRGKIFAKTGLKVGTNYAKHYIKSLNGSNATEKSVLHKETAEQVFTELTKLRGTALKIGQALSVDQGFLPDEFAEVMTQAQYKVPPINRSLVRSIIKQELGQYPEIIFKSFNNDAIAAASIGQVHRATLKDGRKVAVKIQYPGVRDTIASDLSLAKSLFKRLISNSGELDEYFEEIRSTLLLETDYIHEGKSIDRFHKRFTNERVITPEWVPECSTGRILTMTYIDGVHLGDFLESNPTQEERNRYGQLLWDFFHDQVKDHEEIHADTHPGNFFLTNDNRLGVIDFGCVKAFPEDFFQDYLRLLPTHLKKDEPEIKKLYTRLGVLRDDPETSPADMQYYQFCLNYGFAFSMPYKEDSFDFGDPDYKELIRGHTKNAPVGNEPRGNKYFIYSTRAHLGLYHFLMKIKAEINTKKSREIVNEVIKKKV